MYVDIIYKYTYIYIYGKTHLKMGFHRTLVERIPKQPNWTPLIFVKNMVSVFMLSCMIFKKILGFWRSGRVQKKLHL